LRGSALRDHDRSACKFKEERSVSGKAKRLLLIFHQYESAALAVKPDMKATDHPNRLFSLM